MKTLDLPWNDEKTTSFITNVGLITSFGPNGQNIMSAEWTHHISYEPALIAVCIGHSKSKKKATTENILKTKEFGVSIASIEQTSLASIAGGNSGKNINKIDALKKLGYKFQKSKYIKPLTIKNSVLALECKLVKKVQTGDHLMLIGKVIHMKFNKEQSPVAYHQGRYASINFNIPKPSKKKREKQKEVIEKFRK
jgi:flavin reductase (DIM6/NTAB) family NADH-FMN oxidoreductase RutF